MKIENQVYTLKENVKENWLETLAKFFKGHLRGNLYPLRSSIVKIAGGEALVESTMVRFDPNERHAERLSQPEVLSPRKKRFQAASFGVIQVVPTGVRCEIGGFAGDACPATNLLALASDFVITHPNAVNASELNEMAENVLYVEGKSLDDFLLGHLGLHRVSSNRIGTFVDPTGLSYLGDILNTLNAAGATSGIECCTYLVLKRELGVNIDWSDNGCAIGTVFHPETILEGVEILLDNGADAVGGTSVIHGINGEMFSGYLHGELPNPSGGVEAIITHLISKVFRIPTAHAPLPYYQDLRRNSAHIDPRASAEFISIPHYYCVLKGLSKAPRLVSLPSLGDSPSHLITLNNVGAVVAPAGCLGGIPALAAQFNRIPLIAVRENRTVLDVTNDKMQMDNVIEVESYLEAAGVILALREGISLKSLRRPLCRAREIKLAP